MLNRDWEICCSENWKLFSSGVKISRHDIIERKNSLWNHLESKLFITSQKVLYSAVHYGDGTVKDCDDTASNTGVKHLFLGQDSIEYVLANLSLLDAECSSLKTSKKPITKTVIEKKKASVYVWNCVNDYEG